MIFNKTAVLSLESEETARLDKIPIEMIRANPYQPRKNFTDEALISLSNSIKQYGLLQPITVRRIGEKYEIIAGERRFRACKLAGFTHVKAIVMEHTIDQDSAMLAMIENIQRENLHFFEEAEGLQRLIREHGFTQDELARKLSKNQSTVANKLRILRLPGTVKQKIVAGGLTERHARALLRLHNEKAQLSLADRIIKEALSVKCSEDLVEKELNRLYGEVEDERKPKVMKFMSDYRIYINTIKKTVEKIAEAGLQTDMQVIEQQDAVTVTVRLRK